MINLFQIFFGIIILFFILLGVKQFFNGKFKREFCAICFAVSLTWVFLFFLYFKGIFLDKTLLALLMGMSGLGVFYLWEKSVRKNFRLFRLPLFLTIILILYLLIEGASGLSGVFYLTFGLWAFFFLIYSFRENKKIRKFAKKIVECCKEW